MQVFIILICLELSQARSDSSVMNLYTVSIKFVMGKLAGSLLFTEIALCILCTWTSASCRDCCQDGTPFKVHMSQHDSLVPS